MEHMCRKLKQREDRCHGNIILVSCKCVHLCTVLKACGVPIGFRVMGTNTPSPSLPPLGGSQLLPLCLSIPALPTTPPTQTPGSRPGCQQCGGPDIKAGACRRVALGTFILLSVSLRFRKTRTSVNKHRPGTLSRPLNTIQAPPVSPLWFTNMAHNHFCCIHRGLRQPPQRTRAPGIRSCVVSCF